MIWKALFKERVRARLKKDMREVALDLWVADSFLRKAVGFMFRGKPREDEGILFPMQGKACMWMGLVSFPLTLLFVEQGIVREEVVLRPYWEKGRHSVCSTGDYVVELNERQRGWLGAEFIIEGDF